MLKIIFVYGTTVVTGALAGAGLGFVGPLLLANLEQRLRPLYSSDPSSAAIGFAIILTAPGGLLFGGYNGWTLATRLRQSGEGLGYLFHGTGLVSLACALVGVASCAFVVWRFR